MSPPSIAERKMMFSPKGEATRHELTIRVGVPYWDKDGFGRCPVEYEGLFASMDHAPGVDLLDALVRAADVEKTLRALSGKYDFFWSNGESYF